VLVKAEAGFQFRVSKVISGVRGKSISYASISASAPPPHRGRPSWISKPEALCGQGNPIGIQYGEGRAGGAGALSGRPVGGLVVRAINCKGS
jgi:hypothetical protein